MNANHLTSYRFTFPAKVVSEANVARRSHWPKTKRADAQEDAVWKAFRAAKIPRNLATPIRVHLVRHGLKLLDDDNLANGFKRIRDTIAKMLGYDDGDRDNINFTYDEATVTTRANADRVTVTITEGCTPRHHICACTLGPGQRTNLLRLISEYHAANALAHDPNWREAYANTTNRPDLTGNAPTTAGLRQPDSEPARPSASGPNRTLRPRRQSKISNPRRKRR